MANVQDHVVSVDQHGRPLDPLTHRPMSEPAFQAHVARVLDLALTPNEGGGPSKLLIYVHGGLNNVGSARKKAETDADNIVQAGYYPVFIGWRSGLLSTYAEHLTRLRQGRVTGRLRGWLTAPLYLVGDVGDGVMHAPALLVRRVFNSARSRADRRNARALYTQLEERYKEARAGGGAAMAVQWPGHTGGSPRLHGFTSIALALLKWVPLMLLDGIGSAAWRNMLRRTKTAFRRPAEFDIGDRHDDSSAVKATLDAGTTGALAVFLDALATRVSLPGPLAPARCPTGTGARSRSSATAWAPSWPTR